MLDNAHESMVSKLRGYIALAVLFVGLVIIAVGYAVIAVETVVVRF